MGANANKLVSNCEFARRQGVSESCVRRWIRLGIISRESKGINPRTATRQLAKWREQRETKGNNAAWLWDDVGLERALSQLDVALDEFLAEQPSDKELMRTLESLLGNIP